jgi:DNA-binding MarR family transcriptional regulator
LPGDAWRPLYPLIIGLQLHSLAAIDCHGSGKGRYFNVICTADEMANTHGILLRRCQQVALALFTEEATEFDFSPTQYSALSFIHKEPGIQQNALGERIALDRSSVTKCVEGLERRGLIRREVDKKDKRARRLFVTPRGKAMLENLKEAAIRARQRITHALGDERFTSFLESLKEFSGILSDEKRSQPLVDRA